MDEATQKAIRCYEIIGGKSNNNTWIQGISGIFGYPFTLAADIGVIPGIYAPLWSELRAVYGLDRLSVEAVGPLLKNMVPEVLTDIAFDKLLGNVPVVGIYFNAICAKTMTWRLGTVFSMLSARGDEIISDNVAQCMKLIRSLFPQSDMFKFVTPDQDTFVQLVSSVTNIPSSDYRKKIESALEAMK